jgi:drug/metabolite transporter (DMT)-like permease
VTPRLAGMGAAAAVILLFSSFSVVSRLATREVLAPPDIAALRFAVAGLALGPLLWRFGLSGLSRAQALALSVTGGLGFALFAYHGLALTPASQAGVLLHGTLPLFGTLAGAVLLGEWPTPARLLGCAIILCGVLLPATTDAAGEANPLGLALLGAAACCWASYGALARRLRLRPLRAAAIVAPVTLLLYLPPYLLLHGLALLDVPAATLLWQAAFQGLLIGVVSLLLYTASVSLLGATETALAMAAIPGLTAALGIPLLGEHPPPLAWAGVALATAGMLLALRPSRQGSSQRC